MKKILCLLAILGLSCAFGCAPSDNGGADEDNTTSQIKSQDDAVMLVTKC